MTKTDLESLASHLSTSPNYRVIRRFEPVERYCADDGKPKKRGIFLDIETTGFSSESDKIIELALLPFEFNGDGQIFAVSDCFCELEDPGVPIPEDVSKLTGITDDDVRGKKIDDDKVSAVLDSVAIVIAHNSGFDRPFVEKRFPVFEKLAWGCSQSQIPWAEEGISSRALEFIAYRYGFFFDGHRAEVDCRAPVHILAQNLPQSSESVLKTLLDNARLKSYRLWAKGASIEKKDLLKNRRYKWRPDSPHRAWCIEVSEQELQSEKQFLYTQIFGREVQLPVDTIDYFNRFSERSK